MGAGFAAGPDWTWDGGDGPERTALSSLDVKIGVLLRRSEYSLVYAPWMYFSGPPTSHGLRLEMGSYYPLGRVMYFATRFSLGGVFGGHGSDVRRGLLSSVDIINLGFTLGGALLEANLGRLRTLTDFHRFEMGLLFGATFHYGVPN
jgi:hypothetical protein